jgi:uncharacterized membrane protein YfcA
VKNNKFKAISLGLITGLVNGLFGSGGGTIAVPFMQRFLKVEEHDSHANAIAVILPLSIMSTFIYSSHLKVDWNSLLYVSLGGIIGGIFGAKLLNKLSAKWLHKIFGFFMIAASIRMIIG